jgi:hypothetical protein
MRDEDAARCIQTIDGILWEGEQLLCLVQHQVAASLKLAKPVGALGLDGAPGF